MISSERRCEYIIRADGLHVSIRSKNRPHTILKGMLVSHNFIKLLRSLLNDNSFDKDVYDDLDDDEKDFLKYCLNKLKIANNELDDIYNEQINHLVQRLKLLDQSLEIGDDNTDIKKEIKDIFAKLYKKNQFSSIYYHKIIKKYC